MRLTEFHQLIEDEFGRAKGRHLLHSHVLATRGETVQALVDDGADLREVWLEICRDFDVPEERRLGRDMPGRWR
ncbi:MAG: DUF3046 domain-containing protein [Corynebacterium sp.]|uniref:DUF3046 domain-containing protein n=1 Tax=Corynebacterium sp. TaxID=1720 RepID=UPI0026E05205|nr:DUF3046 domain-containing protein [Corynebacterium sp.]MDO5669524.1 DUF3046 domain-containing protein [Corynebacterium sp.]